MINVTMPGALYSKSPPPGVTIISSMTLYTVFLLFTYMVRINVKTRFLLLTYGSDNILNVDHYFLLSWFIMFVTNWAKIQNWPSTDHIFKYITLKTISPVLCDNILCSGIYPPKGSFKNYVTLSCLYGRFHWAILLLISYFQLSFQALFA